MTVIDSGRNKIIKTALDLFLKNSINSTTIRDIADATGIGEATIYRHFTKSSLVIETSVFMTEKLVADYFMVEQKNTGIEQIEDFYYTYYNIFVEHPEYYRFVNELDGFIASKPDIDTKPYEE